jgi:hypothetical protein
MKRKLVALTLVLAFLSACAYFQTVKARTETMVISYETVGMVAFPTVLAYLQEKEKNGSLSGDALVKAKASYKTAKSIYVKAGNGMIQIIDGKPGVSTADIAVLLRQVAVLLADLGDGKVEGNSLTLTKPGGAK